MRYHDLRHGAASLMAAQGVPARVAMEILGHSQISTTMNVYAHVAPELGRDAAERIGATLWGGVSAWLSNGRKTLANGPIWYLCPCSSVDRAAVS